MMINESLPKFYRKVGKNVQKKRIDCGKTQLDLAQNALGLSNESFLSKLENSGEGKHFNLGQLYLIANYLKCDICEFFEGIK